MSTINSLVGGNVRAARLERELTQRDLAERLANSGWTIDATAVARIESGERALRIEQIETLSRALDVSLGALISDECQSSLELDAKDFMGAIEELLEARRRFDQARERLERHISTGLPYPILPKSTRARTTREHD